MKLIVIAILCVVMSRVASAQLTKEQQDLEKANREKAAHAVVDTVKTFGWKHSASTGLNLSQISFKDWVGGGEDALAYSLWLKGASIQDLEQTQWTNAYKFAFGQTRLSSQGLRKTDDEIYLETLLIYRLRSVINPYVSATLRTQFATGYVYPDTQQIAVSKFFDPAYMIQSAGVAFQPSEHFTFRLGAGVREVITSEFNQYADDPETIEIEKTKIQGGLEAAADVNLAIDDNISYSGKLEMFDAFKKFDRILVRNDNTIAAKVSKYISVNFNLQFINDAEVSPLTQIKETIAIGISYILM